MKSKKFLIISIVLFVLAIGFVYYMSQDKLEDFGKLRKQLPKNQITTKAQISKIDEVKDHPVTIGTEKYVNGWLFTYIFDANNKKYMGNYFSKDKTYTINDSITIIYLPDNPRVNEFKK
ncbi:MAG TPA: hypothetical protein ENK91_03640 [Bacteroidetes bacterium]|nr:hypothetical protein [Bacteroidota bacterium]